MGKDQAIKSCCQTSTNYSESRGIETYSHVSLRWTWIGKQKNGGAVEGLEGYQQMALDDNVNKEYFGRLKE